jgi:integrase
MSQFVGVQAKTNKEYRLPINAVMWDLIRSAPIHEILDFTGFDKRWRRATSRAGLKGLQFRDLRRTAATALRDGGVPLTQHGDDDDSLLRNQEREPSGGRRAVSD